MKETMRAMVLKAPNTPLELQDLPIPKSNSSQVLLKVHACGVCRTDLHILDGELTEPSLPLIMGHQIVGTVEETSAQTSRFKKGQCVGVPWLGKSCGACGYCQKDQENLCDNALYTGYQINGGFAEYCVADESFCFPLPDNYDDVHIAPLL